MTGAPRKKGWVPKAHEWQYCQLCKCRMVICGNCGNNCCNGGHGEGCPDKCASAYAMQDAGQDAARAPSAPQEGA